MFTYHFEHGAKADVLSEIEKFQNADGGFGHAIEPDLRTPCSSAIATSQAFKVLRSVDADANHEIVKKAIGYLIETFDDGRMVWDIIPKSAKDSPHAFWWSYEGVEERFGRYFINPTIALTGHLQHFSKSVPSDFLERLLDLSVERLKGLNTEGGFYDLLCYTDLLSANDLAAGHSKEIKDVLRPMVDRSVFKDPKKWGEHVLLPLAIASANNSPLTDLVDSKLVQKNLDFEIESQNDDGSWDVPWSWEAADAQAWQQAEKDWKGYFIVQKLLTLKSFARLA